MTLLTPEQQTLWRSSPHSLLLDVYVDAPQTVFAARLNDPSHLLVPSYTTLPYDGVTTGAYTDLSEGMVVLLGTSAGADDLGRTYLSNIYPSKVCANGLALYIVRASQGRHDGEIIPTDNAYITVLDMRPIYATPPLIDVTGDPDNPITKKAGVVAFNSTYEFEPVCIMGGDRLVKVASASDTYEFVYDWSASYVTHPSGGSIAAYDADFGGEDTSSAASGTVTLPVGRHRIRLTIEDSLGSTFTSWRTWVVTYDGDPNLITGYQITRHSERADGQSFQMRLSKPLSYGTHPDGCEVWVRMREDYGGTAGSLGWLEYHEDMVLSGWIADESNEGEATRRGFIGRTTVTIDDAAGRLKRLAGFPQVVERRATPTRWEHMASANMDRYLYYLLRWHSNALQRVDYIQSGYGAIYPFTVIGSDGQSLWEQVAKRAEAIACVLTCDRYNRLVVLDDPIIAPSAAQIVDALTLFSAYLPQQRTDDVLADIYESDWKNYRFDWMRPPRTHWNWGEAIVASTHNGDSGVDIATVFCIAPGAAPGQGSSEERSGEQLVIASYGQVQLNYREGNRYAARMNAAMGYLTADIRPGDAGLSPARMKWVRFTQTSATAAPRGRTIAAERFLPVELQYQYDHKNGVRKTSIVLEREVEGTPAETYVPYSGTRTTYPPVTIRPPVVVKLTPCAGVTVTANASASADGASVDFTDLSSVYGDLIVAWDWDFDDGSTSTLQNPTHVYSSGGSYDWTLTVTTSCGATDTFGDTVDLSEPSDWLSTSTKIAVFRLDSSVSIGTPGSGLTNHALATTRIKQFVPDFFCDLLLGAGTQVDGWFIGGSTATNPPKLYRIEDIDGARTVTEQYDAQTDTSQADAGLYALVSVPGYYPVVIGRYVINLSSPTRIITVLFTLTTTDGETWVRNDITPDSTPGTGSYILGGAASSVAIDPVTGYVYVGYGVSTTILSGTVTPTTITQGIHESTDGGVTFNDTPTIATSGSAVPGVIHAHDSDLYYTDHTSAGEYNKNGSEVHLTEDGVDHLPFQGFQGNASVSIGINDPAKMAAACGNHASSDRSNFISTDGGDNWSVVGSSGDYPASGQYTHAIVMGDDATKTVWLGRDLAGAGQNIYMKTTGTTTDAQGVLETAAANSNVVGLVRLD